MDTDELIYRDKGGNEFLREKLNRKDGLPDPARSPALIQKRELTPDQTLPQGSRVYEDHLDDEDCLTEEVLRTLSSQIDSRRN